MLFQMLPVFLTVVAFVGIDGRTFGNAFQQRGQMVTLMDIGGGVEINSVVYTFGFCLKTRLSSYPALSRMSIDTGNPLCS